MAYLHIALDGGTKNDVKHLLVDEMQDYSPIQYKVIQKLFPCRKTVLGDASQSVNPYGSSTTDMIQKALVTGEVMKLCKSYRSTCEITDFAQKIRINTDLEPVARHGEKPKVLQFNNEKEELSAIKELIVTYQASAYKSLGIICKTESQPVRWQINYKFLILISYQAKVRLLCRVLLSSLPTWQRVWNSMR